MKEEKANPESANLSSAPKARRPGMPKAALAPAAAPVVTEAAGIRSVDAKTSARVLEMFDRYKEAIHHEDDLVNHRTTWFLAVVSVISVGAAIVFHDYFETVANFVIRRDACLSLGVIEGTIMWLMCCALGAVVAGAANRSITAAIQAHESLELRWSQDFQELAEQMGLPALRGGARPREGAPTDKAPPPSVPRATVDIVASKGAYLSDRLAWAALLSWLALAVLVLVPVGAAIAHHGNLDAKSCVSETKDEPQPKQVKAEPVNGNADAIPSHPSAQQPRR